jgi:hypothetical protein
VDVTEEHKEDERTDGDEGSGTIATRTRTKLSLVDVPIDTLESYLPDTVEPVWSNMCVFTWCNGAL